MTNPTQAVTERYVSNLLRDGQNNEFVMQSNCAHNTEVEGVRIGIHFRAEVYEVGHSVLKDGFATTPASALRRALEKFGVTFR